MVNPMNAAFSPSSMRLGRLDYLFAWITSMLVLGLAAVVTLVALSVVVAALSTTAQQAEDFMTGAMPMVTLALVMPLSIYTGAVLGVKRLHDMGRSGKWMIAYYAIYAACLVANLMSLVNPPLVLVANGLGVVSALALVLLLVAPGTPGANAYGPIPPKF